MASRLAGRVDRIARRITPPGGSDLLRLILEVRGTEYAPRPGDELISLEDLVRESMRQGKEAGTDPFASDEGITKAASLGGNGAAEPRMVASPTSAPQPAKAPPGPRKPDPQPHTPNREAMVVRPGPLPIDPGNSGGTQRWKVSPDGRVITPA